MPVQNRRHAARTIAWGSGVFDQFSPLGETQAHQRVCQENSEQNPDCSRDCQISLLHRRTTENHLSFCQDSAAYSAFLAGVLDLDSLPDDFSGLLADSDFFASALAPFL
ncbi:hypothetical protein Poly21_23750 [Allorhodopirellula heiligendammensis]|uniref:Uncharacterized protein n=1 Tax=Allorhodopirellula heiligendammensis TaxID=2714739 RepID=A0A5C6BTL6_9BACT|nr:hypothetical protein Poly21_23750 [Allorhodopirellula heiligendammensis]